jgi:hypothetical protein
MSNQEPSRRDALRGGTSLLAGAGVALAASAIGREAQAQGTGDVATLNGLLRAEYEAQQAYDLAAGYLMNPDMADPGIATAPVARLVAGLYRSQHSDHSGRLVRLIQSLQGTPVPQAMVVFAPPATFTRTTLNFVRLACNKEKAAAIAYVNALKTLANATAAELAAAIGGVETQHFIALHLLLKGVVGAGPAAMTMINELSPRAVVAIEGESADLSTVSDFAYTPLAMM